MDIDGTRTGPYTVEHLEILRQEGQLQDHNLVTATRLNGAWITVSELLLAYEVQRSAREPSLNLGSAPSGDFRGFSTPGSEHEERTPPSGTPTITSADSFHSNSDQTKSVQIPLRPNGVLEHTDHISNEWAKDDPTLHLLDAIQAVRDRHGGGTPKAAPDALSITHAAASSSPSSFRLPSQSWIIFTLSSVLWITVWGISRINAPAAPSTTANENSSDSSKSVPVAAIAPAVHVAPSAPSRTAAPSAQALANQYAHPAPSAPSAPHIVSRPPVLSHTPTNPQFRVTPPPTQRAVASQGGRGSPEGPPNVPDVDRERERDLERDRENRARDEKNGEGGRDPSAAPRSGDPADADRERDRENRDSRDSGSDDASGSNRQNNPVPQSD